MTRQDDHEEPAKLLNECDQSSRLLLKVENRLYGLTHAFDAAGGDEK